MREVNGIYVRFVDGEVVEYRAEDDQETLDQCRARRKRRLGEVALVDVRSPINQAGVVFYETLFDEDAVCHIAFGQAYPAASMAKPICRTNWARSTSTAPTRI